MECTNVDNPKSFPILYCVSVDMKHINTAKIEIQKTEKELRSLASRSLMFGDYTESEKLIQLAQLMQEVADKITSGNYDFLTDFGGRAPSLEQQAKAQRDYPYFSRKGAYLNRTGWSKKSCKEYHQKIPYEIVEVVIQNLPQVQKLKTPFLIPDIYPLAVLADMRKAKDYQVYMTIGWLKSEGLVKHLGEDGYKLTDPATFLSEAKELWENLQPNY